MAMPLILYIHRYSQKQILRQACLCGMAACVVAVIGSYSRGGFIGLIIFGTTFLVATKHRAVAIVLIVIVIAVGVNFVPDSWVERIHSTGNVDQDASFMGRIIQWKILTLMALDHPFFGEGILANMLPEIWSSYAVRLGSELMFVSTPVPTIPYASHSIFFQVLGENGFTGLFLFLLLYWVAFAAVSDIRRRARRAPGVTWTLDLARAIRMSLLLYLVTGAALPIPYLELPYLLLGCLSALRHIQRREIARLSQEERSGDGVEAISAPAPRLASGRRGATAAGGMPMRGEGLPPQRERLISVNLRSW
jgi:probable O-glycosylation ligase (exosortase A-associated)